MIDREFVFIVYVSDIEASASFYTSLLNLEVSFTSPRYVTMDLAPGVSLALWTEQAMLFMKLQYVPLRYV